jgi:GNAT superfamily N-acetyltransferase
MELRRGDYTLTTDPARVDLEVVHGFLSRSYWAAGIPRELVERSVAGSMVFSIHHASQGQIGFARVITDRATFGYLADVFVLEAHRGQGLAGWLMDAIHAHPELQALRRWMLITRDAHGLYARHGWAPLGSPERAMERVVPNPYLPKPDPEPEPA